jgi:hypothetical protein
MNNSELRVLGSVGLSSPNLVHDLRVLSIRPRTTGFPDERQKAQRWPRRSLAEMHPDPAARRNDGPGLVRRTPRGKVHQKGRLS